MNPSLKIMAGAALAACATLSFAAEVDTTLPPPGPPRSVHVPNAAEHTLGNGLRVIVVRRAELPLVTARFVLLSGSEVDPVALPGAAAMTADLLTRGTATRSAPQIAEAAAALGGEIDASAGWDETDAGITVTTPKLGAALDLLADVVRHPVFAKDEIERARKQAEDGLRLMWSQPGRLAMMVARRAVFGDGGYGHPAEGTPQSLAAFGRDDLVKLHDTWYRPDNAVLVFAGDIEPDAAFALAQKAFGDWAKPASALPKLVLAGVDSHAPAVLAVNLPGAGQAGVVVGRTAIARSAPDYYTGVVANAVLGGSYSARMNEEIRIKRGLSYGARSSLDALRDGGWLMTSAQTKNPSAAEVVQLSLAQLASLTSTPATDKELAARKATLIGSFGRSLDTTAGLAAQITERAVYGIDLGEINDYIAKVQAVSAADVVKFAKAHLGSDAAHVVVVGDASVYGAAMKKAWPKARSVEAKSLDLARGDLGLGK
jgi:zinc protease